MDDVRQGTCPLCKHNEIIEAELQESDRDGLPSPLPVCWGAPPPGSNRWQPLGVLKAYVCRRCGRTELFAQSPEKLPIGRPHRTRIIQGPEPTPYR